MWRNCECTQVSLWVDDSVLELETTVTQLCKDTESKELYTLTYFPLWFINAMSRKYFSGKIQPIPILTGGDYKIFSDGTIKVIILEKAKGKKIHTNANTYCF